jgi:hypothetical protein
VFKKAYPARYFGLAASKLGNPARARWCYSNELFNGSFALNNNVAGNTRPLEFAIIANFQSTQVVEAYFDEFGQVACESY